MALLSNNTKGDDFTTHFHFPTSNKALIIFTRNPELGKCKTRLAAGIGDEIALKIYKLLLDHTVQITKNLTVDKFVFYSEEIWIQDIWNSEIYRKKLQDGSDLGIRMENAFSELFTIGYKDIIIIGTDMLDLSKEDLEEAFLTLNKHNFVIGPALDGGYYLLGMKQLNSDIFKNKNWGTNTVLGDTLKDLENETVGQLPIKTDIDSVDDIKAIDIFREYLN